MKRLKGIVAACGLLVAGTAFADDYNRVSLSFNMDDYNYNKEFDAQVLINVRVKDKKTAQDDPAVQAAVQAVAAELGDTGRILVRESGTEPLVRVMVEAPEKEQCQTLAQRVVDVINSQGHRAE